jgi:poly(3-hydroxybutyrate) depolymerase
MRRAFVALTAALLVASSVPGVLAQQIPYLQEMMSRYEEVNRLYKEKQRAGGNLSQFAPLMERGEKAFRSGNLQAILEMEGEALALLQGRTWDEREKFLSSLTLHTDRLVIEPGAELEISLKRMFPANLDKAFSDTPTVTYEIVTVGPEVIDPVVLADKLKVTEMATSIRRKVTLEDGTYFIAARIESAGKKVSELLKPVFALKGFAGKIAQLTRATAELKQSSDAKVKTIAEELPTIEFKLERLSTLARSMGEDDINPIEELSQIEGWLAAFAKGENPLAAERGELERAYRSGEGKLTPYRLYIPEGYDGKRAWPVVVLLHGVMGDEKYYFSGLFDPEVIQGEAERRGYILASVHGGGRFGGYAGRGQEDALEVMKAVTRNYQIDPNRVFLTGHSMGAAGAWLIASSKPETFAAIAPVSGGVPLQGSEQAALLAKLKDMPALVIHGAKDGIVPVESSRKAVEAAKKAGVKVIFQEMPEANHLTVVAATFPAVLDFFDKNGRQPAEK